MNSRQIVTAIVILIFFRIDPQEGRNLNCGIRSIHRTALISNGWSTNDGDFPWHAGIFHIGLKQDIAYKCGGTVLNSNTILTAAHCVFENDRPLINDRIIVNLGTHHLIPGAHAQQFDVHKVIIHPEYNLLNLNNDIAIIRLATEATLNDYVQPICLWDSSKPDISDITGRLASVIGWGITETNRVSNVLRQALIPIVSHSTCLSSNSDFYNTHLTEGNFCAGFRNGTSACSGDSGGSLSLEEGGVQYIRGIVSLTSPKKDDEQDLEDNLLCNVNEYVVFTDVVHYLPWIQLIVPQLRPSPVETDLMLYRPGTGLVYVFQNRDSVFSPLYSSINGIGGYDLQSGNDRAFAFDYDHSGKIDHIGLYRPATGTMWILKNRNGQFSPVYAQGDTGIGIGGYDLRSIYDRAFAFDYDHSGKMDHIVLYRPGTGTMWILKNQNEKFSAVYAQGDPGIGIGGYDLRSYSDRAFAFDYNHSGKMDHIVLYRPGTGTMWILKNRNGQFSSVYAQGDPGIGIGGYDLRSLNDRAFAFDYDHSGKMDHIVLYRPGTGTMWILKNQNGMFSAVYAQGDPGAGIGGYDLRSVYDRAFAFDYNNIGKKDHITLYRPGTGTIWILKNQNGNFSTVYAQGDPGNGIGGFDLKSNADRIITFESS